jgi:hypothetical protein
MRASKVMTTGQSTQRIIDLGEYRAARQAAKHRKALQTRYILWYPGVGYLHVIPGACPLSGETVGSPAHQRPGLRGR